MATEILRPNAAGDEENIDYVVGDGVGTHYTVVDEVTPDELTSYVYTSTQGAAYLEDLYNLPAHSGSGTINHITVYIRCASYSVPERTGAYVHIKTEGVEHNGSEETLTTSWINYSKQWTTNPQVGGAWTWTQIDALQIGVGLRGGTASGKTIPSRCTQVYVEVDYSAGAVYEESCSDGFKVGDTNKGSLVLSLSVTNGFKPGDTPASIGTFNALASNGAKLSEALATMLETNPAVTDGVKVGDSVAMGLLFSLLASDGLKAGDLASLFLTIPCSASDGVKLSEALATLLQTYPSLTDGLKAGDTPSTQAILNALASDGVKLGDTSAIYLLIGLLLSDGVKLSEVVATLKETYPTLTDGLKLSEALTAQLEIDLAVTDGVKLSDVITLLWILKQIRVQDAVRNLATSRNLPSIRELDAQ